eukprot:6110240-Amphidinium_carterae.1
MFRSTSSRVVHVTTRGFAQHLRLFPLVRNAMASSISFLNKDFTHNELLVTVYFVTLFFQFEFLGGGLACSGNSTA